MPKIYEVRLENASGDVILLHSAAEIVSYDETNADNLTEAPNVQVAITKINNKMENAVSELNTSIEKCATTATLTATIAADGFDGTSAPYTQTIPLTGILETDNPIIDVVLNDDSAVALQELDAWCYVNEIQTLDDQLVIRCLEAKPDADIHIQIKLIR